jgi:predicted transcriptional regulator
MENLFIDKHQDNILGSNSCFDRVIIKGSIIPLAYQKGLLQFLCSHNIRLKDFVVYAKTLADCLKENATAIAKAENAPYIYLKESKISKEDFVKSIIKDRGCHPGLVAVLTALEVDNSYDIFKNKQIQQLELVARQRKCLHIYFYFIDEKLGLCYFRVQTFFPFKVQIYFNGNEKLACDLDNADIAYQKDDNCFTWISDLQSAQQLADDVDVPIFHDIFDQWVDRYVPILDQLRQKWNLSYHWTIKQIEYAADILFKSQAKLENLYKQLLQYDVLSVLPEDIMVFLGKKPTGLRAGRIETSCKKTYQGYRLKHRNGPNSIKMYNKAGNVLRIEITCYDISEFSVYREVHQTNGQIVKKLAAMKKSIYSFEHVVRIAKAAINRYLDYLSKMADNSTGLAELRLFTERKTENNRNFQGFNPLNRDDCIIFQQLVNKSFIANGFTNKSIKLTLSQQMEAKNWNTGKVSRLIKRLRVFGLVRKVQKTYKYFLTEKGRMLTTLAIKLRNITVIPAVDCLVRDLQLSTV